MHGYTASSSPQYFFGGIRIGSERHGWMGETDRKCLPDSKPQICTVPVETGELLPLENGVNSSKLAGQNQSAQLKGDATAPLGALLDAQSAAILAECCARDEEQPTKGLLKRLITLMRKRKNKVSKKSESRQSGSDLDLIFDQAETTLGELLLRTAASFGRGSSTSLRSRRNSMSRIWNLRGRVFCGSSNILNDMDVPGVAPLDFQEVNAEGYWQSLADAMIEGKYAAAPDWVSEGDQGSAFPDSAPISSDAKTISQNDVSGIVVTDDLREPGCRRSQSEIMASTEDTRMHSSCEAAWSSPMENLRDQILGGSTRLNTRLEESPMLINNKGIVAAARVRSRSSGGGCDGGSAEATQPLEKFLSLRRSGGGGGAAVATPSRVSLKCLLQENEEAEAVWCEAEVEAAEEEAAAGAEVLEAMCCVCMVGRKGAALVPCGHTFCRSCTKQLWARRGACPLCNNLITQVLHIF